MKSRNIPEPGEDRAAPLDRQAEAQTAGPIPDGELPLITAPSSGMAPAVCEPVLAQHRYEPHEVPEASGDDRIRRTSTEGDTLPIVVLLPQTEQRLDHTAAYLPRENALDPAQDNAGPQADQS